MLTQHFNLHIITITLEDTLKLARCQCLCTSLTLFLHWNNNGFLTIRINFSNCLVSFKVGNDNDRTRKVCFSHACRNFHNHCNIEHFLNLALIDENNSINNVRNDAKVNLSNETLDSIQRISAVNNADHTNTSETHICKEKKIRN